MECLRSIHFFELFLIPFLVGTSLQYRCFPFARSWLARARLPSNTCLVLTTELISSFGHPKETRVLTFRVSALRHSL